MGAFSGGRKARQLRLGGPPLLVPRAPGEERLDLPFLYALPLAIGAKRVPKCRPIVSSYQLQVQDLLRAPPLSQLCPALRSAPSPAGSRSLVESEGSF